MDVLSVILVALVVLWAIAAVGYLVRHRGGCCGGSKNGGCNGCCGNCGGCHTCK